ncbi:hypothetical protein V1525DRAFT_388839 [Lipomyces kononenkoae]|uniref:Uncharacterized protein n=1 Tax=Lipomyces kononenkoae TaxID=34357 RepID=A0ACC3SZP6_LIPKO
MTLPPIALPYRLYFLYIEPLFALSGAYLPVFKPNEYLSITVPQDVLYPSLVSPSLADQTVTALLMTHISSLYVFFAFNEGVVLRCTSSLKVWRALLLGCLLSDIGHLYAASTVTQSAIFWNPLHWGNNEWANFGTLWLGAILRVAFLCRVGVGQPFPSEKL